MRSIAKIETMALALWLAACGAVGEVNDDDGDGGAASEPNGNGTGGSGTSGTTECGTASCPAGQYCADSFSETCVPGCTSNQNCASGAECDIDEVTKTGTCTATKNCAGFLEKCQACGGGDECTQSLCDMYSTACVNCAADLNCADDPTELCSCSI